MIHQSFPEDRGRFSNSSCRAAAAGLSGDRRWRCRPCFSRPFQSLDRRADLHLLRVALQELPHGGVRLLQAREELGRGAEVQELLHHLPGGTVRCSTPSRPAVLLHR